MRKLVIPLFVCISAIVFFLAGCDPFGLGVDENSIYGKARQVAPEFTPASRSISRAWTSGDVVYELFNALREFDPARDEGVIDRSNMYKMLYDTSTLWAGLQNKGTALPSAVVLIPPFNFGNNFSYTYARNLTSDERAVAYSGTGNAIISWIWREPTNKREIGVLEMSPIGGDPDTIMLDFIFCVDYDDTTPESEYNMRSHLNGNLTTHEFEYRSIRGGATEGTNMVGKGISEGAGNYFLFKIRTGSTSPVYYLVIPAGADETALQAINLATDAYTDPAQLPASVAAYKDYVVNTPFYDVTEMPRSVNELNVGNANAGTIYINY